MQNIYTVTVPVFVKLLGGLKNVLDKTEAHVQSGALSEAALLKDALAPDMFPFKRQVQIACDNAKGATARLTGKENPKMEDTEETIVDLKKRIDRTLAFISSATAEDFVGAEDRKISLPYFPDKYMNGSEYALEYALPNFIFHVVTAYGIARKNGVPVGKADFINGMPLRDLN